MKVVLAGSITVLALAMGEARAADLMPRMPVKAPAQASAADDWTGFHIGGHFGWAGGQSDWTANGNGSPPVSGTLGFFNTFDAFSGTGSFFGGLQAGYDRMFASHLVLGAEADVSFPNMVGSAAILSSPVIGQASYAEIMQLFGTVRGRAGYAVDHWLFYATGGLAWTYDQFTRTQLAGAPVGGTATPGTVDQFFMVPRLGWTAGAGAELALGAGWSARLEYLLMSFGSRGVDFPAGAQRYDSDLVTQSLRVGFDYKLGADPKRNLFTDGLPALDVDRFNLHVQTTFLDQYVFPFRNPYSGTNSLDPNHGRETWDVTFYAGLRLWEGAELWVDPEIDQGFGLSGTLGVAGFPSGEAYKVGASVPYTRLPRYFIRQTIDLGGASEKVDADLNQFAGSRTENRMVFTVGKFGVTDVFDTNKYAHDPRGDFMNWTLVDTATFDYAADAWGYTYGAAAEWYEGKWTLRAGLFDLSNVPNSSELDSSFGQFQWVGEIEHRHELWGRAGKIAVTGFLSRGRMGLFDDAVALANATGQPADISAVRQYRSRGGVSVNAEQEVADDLGVFARAGLANGAVETYEFTDVDRTVAAGLSLKGTRWGRPDDTVGFAGIVNGISSAHEAFLNAGGLGILVGDGQLPNPGLEQIMETYYSFPMGSVRVTFDYQFIVNPGYNRDRGPVSVIGTRVHTQF